MKIIPIYTPAQKQYFSDYGSPVRLQRALNTFHTHLLKPDVNIPILALSENQPLLETGLLERTDYIEPIDPRPRISGLLLRVIRDEGEFTYYQELEENDHTTTALQRDFDQMGELGVKATLIFGVHDGYGDSSAIIVEIKAHLNTIQGTLSLEARAVCQDTDFADGVEVVGYDMDIHRYNSDRKSVARTEEPKAG